MSEETSKFEQWAIVEVMGHRRFAGLVTEQTIGGSSFVRVDVPAVETGKENFPAFTKLFGAGSIYCISPITETMARDLAASWQERPVSIYDLPAHYRPRPVAIESHEPMEDDGWDD